MANACTNELHIQGNSQTLKNFMAAVGLARPNPEFDFNGVVSRFDAKFAIDRFEVVNWGSYSNAKDSVLTVNSDEDIHIKFTTDWTPPIQLITTASALYPELTFTMKYIELGCNFAGIATAQDGFLEREKWDDDVQGFAIQELGWDAECFEDWI